MGLSSMASLPGMTGWLFHLRMRHCRAINKLFEMYRVCNLEFVCQIPVSKSTGKKSKVMELISELQAVFITDPVDICCTTYRTESIPTLKADMMEEPLFAEDFQIFPVVEK